MAEPALPTSDADLGYLPATDLAALIRARRLSPVEAMAAILRRIEAAEPRVNAFATLDAEGATAGARAAEAAVMRGETAPLLGVPFTVKDMAPVAGLPMECGSHIRRGYVPPEDATMVRRLKQAGGIVLGKTTSSEFGWSAISRSPLTGITHNPWRHGYNAGASSAGAGAAAAAGFGPLHQGSDGAGSIRLPAHFSGVVGIKPSFGRVPYTPMPNNDLISHIGPITRTVADSALMLRVMSGPDAADFLSLEAPPADYPALLGGGVRGLRIAYSPDLGFARVDPEVAAPVRAAAEAFAQELGATVEEVTPPWASEGPEVSRFFWLAMCAGYAQYLDEFGDRMDPGFAACVREGVRIPLRDFMEKRVRRLAYGVAINRWFEDWDLLLTPSASVAAFPAERNIPEHWPQHEWDWERWAEFSYPFNFSANPAISVPCGFTPDGLPVGLQIVGRRLDEVTVLRAAAAWERARPWAERRPALG
ncbi:amidase family protein [Roseomonas sp. NAR14]|uniref:Amidase family protein n=1 Tax=Roseomonas acroporae TaxID=2937791 RepID=A0A9X2BUB5_9PROT|nr:amidase family protein [Roseomonas acroporae]MCK8785337.1 amidase family protein [Roseomonas acroporae]